MHVDNELVALILEHGQESCVLTWSLQVMISGLKSGAVFMCSMELLEFSINSNP